MRVIVAVVLSSVLSACGNGADSDCRSGMVPVTSGIIASSLVAPANSQDLPSDFEFSAAEMRAAFVGTWTDATNAIQLVIAVKSGASIDYSVAGAGTDCLTIATLALTGQWTNTATTAAAGGEGLLAAGLVLAGASADMYVGQGAAAKNCHLVYQPASGATPARLQGDCDLAGIGLGQVNVSFTK